MIKMLVVSDTHGNHRKLARIIDRERPFDYLVHCGDGIRDLFHVDVPEETVVVRVSGNIDLAGGSEMERIAELAVGPINIMVSHGDLFKVHIDYDLLEREGLRRKADIVMFGHTHIRYRRPGKPFLFNPGPGLKGDYGLVLIGRDIQYIHNSIED